MTPAKDRFRPVPHRFELRLARWSTVNEICPAPVDFPIHAYKLRSFQSMIDNIGDETFLVDLIGIVTGVPPLVSVDVKGRQVSKRVVRLTVMRQTAILALWGENADGLDADALVVSSRKEPVIALVMGCTYNLEDSMLSLSASYGSKICINMANPDVVFLRNRRIGSVQCTIEWIIDKGQRFRSLEVENVDVSCLASMIPHVAVELESLPDAKDLGKKDGTGARGAAADKRKDKRQRSGTSKSHVSKKLFTYGAGGRRRATTMLINCSACPNDHGG